MVALLLVLAGCSGGGAAPASPIMAAVLSPATPPASLGDSITAGYTLTSPTLAYPFLIGSQNLGIDGETAVGAVIDELPKLASAKFVTIFLGTNDVAQGESLAAFRSAMQTLVAGARARSSTVLVVNIPDYGSRAPYTSQHPMIPSYNAVINSLGVPVVDMYSDAAYTADLAGKDSVDGIHPGPIGQAEIARMVTLMISTQ